MAELATDGFAHIRDRAAVIEQRRGHMRERIWYTKTKNMVDLDLSSAAGTVEGVHEHLQQGKLP